MEAVPAVGLTASVIQIVSLLTKSVLKAANFWNEVRDVDKSVEGLDHEGYLRS
jgi:hypothetical protein